MTLLNPYISFPPATDRALGAPATASAQYSSFAPSRMVDGNDTTEAIATSAQPSWLKVDLGAAYMITEFRCVNAQFGVQNCTLQSSPDNATWTDRYPYITGSTTTQKPLRVATSARYWRLLNTDNNGLNIRTLNLYENGAVWSGATLGEDVARNSVITQTNTFSSFVARRAIDGDDATEAIAQTSGGTASMTIDLLTPITIASYRVKDKQFAVAIDLQYSNDGSSWTSTGKSLVGVADNQGTFTTPITARYWRLTKANTLNVETFSLFAA